MVPAKNSVAAINAMRPDTPPEVFVYQLDTCTPAQFDKLAIAEAFGGAPKSLTEVLLRPQYRQDLLDSLTGAEATSRISLMHRLYESGPVDGRVVQLRHNLARLRSRLKWLDANRLPDDARQRDKIEQWAFDLLRKAHPDEYHRLYTRMQEQYGVVARLPDTPPGVTTNLAVWIPLAGFPCPELSQLQRELKEGHREPFRERVVREVKDLDLDTVLDHPLLVQRWTKDLDHLGDFTCQTLHIVPEHDRFVSDVDLVLNRDMPADQARARIGQFRFLAGVYARKAQAARTWRRCHESITRWKFERDLAAVRAREALIAAFPHEYTTTVRSYDEHKDRQRVAEKIRIATAPPAQHHARKVLPHKAAEFLNRAARLGWDVNIYSPDAVRHRVFPDYLVLVAHQGRPNTFPALTCVFRRVAKTRSWNTTAANAVTRDGRWVTFSDVAALMHLLDLPADDIAKAVQARAEAVQARRAQRPKPHLHR